MYTLEDTVLIQSFRNFVRMLSSIHSSLNLKLGLFGLTAMSLGQRIEFLL